MSISDYLDKMVVTALSPDRNIRARISDYTNVELGFRPNVYDRYSESDLSHQLARLGLLTWVSYHRGRTEAYQKSQGLSADELAEAEKPSPDGRRQRYEKALNEIAGVGVSAGRVVRIRTTGMMQWEVDLKPGALRQLTEDRFLAEAQSAVQALLGDRKMKVILLKSQHYDIGIPRKWREAMTELQAINRRQRW